MAADFTQEYEHTDLIEDIYKCTLAGETYKSISRFDHPDCPIWKIIDRKRHEPDFPYNLQSDEHLEFLVRKFYKEHYWDRYRLDNWPSQFLANEMFRSGLRLGRKSTIKFLQRALNVLNRKGTLWDDVKVDGVYGDKTHEGVLSFFRNIPQDKWPTLFFCLTALQGEKYISLAEQNVQHQDNMYIWFDHLFRHLHHEAFKCH